MSVKVSIILKLKFEANAKWFGTYFYYRKGDIKSNMMKISNYPLCTNYIAKYYEQCVRFLASWFQTGCSTFNSVWKTMSLPTLLTALGRPCEPVAVYMSRLSNGSMPVVKSLPAHSCNPADLLAHLLHWLSEFVAATTSSAYHKAVVQQSETPSSNLGTVP